MKVLSDDEYDIIRIGWKAGDVDRSSVGDVRSDYRISGRKEQEEQLLYRLYIYVPVVLHVLAEKPVCEPDFAAGLIGHQYHGTVQMESSEED